MTIKTQSARYLRPLNKYRQAKTPFEYISQRISIPVNGDSGCWLWVGVKDMVSKGRHFNGAKKNPDTQSILDAHGKKSCKDVSKVFGISYSRVYQIWRENGKTGRNH